MCTVHMYILRIRTETHYRRRRVHMSANVGCAVIAPAFCPPGTRARSARRPSDGGVDVYITYAGVWIRSVWTMCTRMDLSMFFNCTACCMYGCTVHTYECEIPRILRTSTYFVCISRRIFVCAGASANKTKHMYSDFGIAVLCALPFNAPPSARGMCSQHTHTHPVTVISHMHMHNRRNDLFAQIVVKSFMKRSGQPEILPTAVPPNSVPSVRRCPTADSLVCATNRDAPDKRTPAHTLDWREWGAHVCAFI